MGSSYYFSCKRCGHKQQLYEGWSFMIHNQSVKKYFKNPPLKLHYKTAQKINLLSKNTPKLHLRIEYQIHRCKSCKKVFDKLFVQLNDGDKTLHQTKFKCSHCHITLNHTNIHRLKYASCPKCNSMEFTKTKDLTLWN